MKLSYAETDCSSLTHSHRVLHVCDRALELGEVQLGTEGEGEIEVSAGASRVKHCCLAVLAVGEHPSVVLACGDPL